MTYMYVQWLAAYRELVTDLNLSPDQAFKLKEWFSLHVFEVGSEFTWNDYPEANIDFAREGRRKNISRITDTILQNGFYMEVQNSPALFMKYPLNRIQNTVLVFGSPKMVVYSNRGECGERTQNTGSDGTPPR